MSSILKALKKLEGEQLNQERVQSLSRAVYLKKGGGGSPGSRPRKAGFRALALVLCAGGFLGWFYMKHDGKKTVPDSMENIPRHLKQKPGSPAVEQATRETVEKPSKPLTRNISPGVPAPSASRESRNQVMDPGPKTPVDTFGQKSPTDLRSKSLIPAEKDREVPSSPLPPDEKRNTVEPPDGSRKDLEARAGDEAPWIETSGKEDPAKDALIPLLEGSDLKLQAIAWADDPKSRIAVINGSIVREGDSIGNMLVMRINEDEILLRESGEVRKLVFRLH